MIRPPFDRPDVLEKLRPAWAAARSLLLPGAADPEKIKKNFFSSRFRRFDLANRGRYEVAEIRNAAISRELLGFAQGVTGARLTLRSLRLYRFRRGGYSLFYDDALTRIPAGVEVTVDLSSRICGPPAVYQSSATQRLEVPQVPGLVAVVERGPSTYRYDRYLPAAVGRARVLRLRAAFLLSD